MNWDLFGILFSVDLLGIYVLVVFSFEQKSTLRLLILVNCVVEQKGEDSKPEVNVVKMSLFSGEQITKALQSCHYQNMETTKQGVLEVLKKFKGIEAELNHFAFNNGSKELRLTLTGTIPVEAVKNGKGKIYIIPVVIWLPVNYPDKVPEPHLKPRFLVQPVSRKNPFLSNFGHVVEENGSVYIRNYGYKNKSENVLVSAINDVIRRLADIDLSEAFEPDGLFFVASTDEAPATSYSGMYRVDIFLTKYIHYHYHQQLNDERHLSLLS